MYNTELKIIINNFQDFCENDIISGKARSYRLAIEYLFEYLGINKINKSSLLILRKVYQDLNDKNGIVYKNVLEFLSNRGQKSYLTKGWINAGVKHFFRFVQHLDNLNIKI